MKADAGLSSIFILPIEFGTLVYLIWEKVQLFNLLISFGIGNIWIIIYAYTI